MIGGYGEEKRVEDREAKQETQGAEQCGENRVLEERRKCLTKWKKGGRDILERGEKSEGEQARD